MIGEALQINGAIRLLLNLRPVRQELKQTIRTNLQRPRQTACGGPVKE